MSSVHRINIYMYYMKTQICIKDKGYSNGKFREHKKLQIGDEKKNKIKKTYSSIFIFK